MTILDFNQLVNYLLRKESEIVQQEVRKRIDIVSTITDTEVLKKETVALIIMQTKLDKEK